MAAIPGRRRAPDRKFVRYAPVFPMIASRFRKLQQTPARLLLTLAFLPTGPVMGMGAVAPEDLGLRVTEAAPKLGAHIRLARRTTSLDLARQAARGAWFGISEKVDGVVLPAKIFGKGKKLQERRVRFALEALNRTHSFTSSLFSGASPALLAVTSAPSAAPRAEGATGAGQAPLPICPRARFRRRRRRRTRIRLRSQRELLRQLAPHLPAPPPHRRWRRRLQVLRAPALGPRPCSRWLPFL